MAGIGKKIQMFLWYMNFLRQKKYKQPYINQYSGRCCVLANGPSLKDALAKYDAGEVDITSDSVMVNLAALDDHFWKIKPKHMCFSDILFCQDYEPRKEQVRKQFDMFNEQVDWDINFYLCYTSHKDVERFISYSRITNPKIHFMPMNENYVDKWPIKYWKRMLDSGYFMPHKGNVANVAMHVALLCGYNEIEVYGIDHDRFLHFYMADSNQLHIVEQHFYDKTKEQTMTPATNAYSGNTRVSEVIEAQCFQFRSHEIHAWWAKQKGVHILNCTPNSMVDCYDRLGRDGKVHPCIYDADHLVYGWEAYY